MITSARSWKIRTSLAGLEVIDPELKQASRDQAALDLNAKLRLESQLRPRIKEIERTLVREVTRTLGRSGNLPDVVAISADKLEPVLRSHYSKVGEVFSKRLRDNLPPEAAMTEKEAEEINVALASFFDQRAPTQARAISKTTQKNAIRSINVAEQERQRLVDQGEDTMSQREVALVAGNVFSHSLSGRTTGIVMLETQAPAEAAKLTEVDVLLGLSPFVLGGRSVSPEQVRDVTKAWVTQGDSRVRTPPDSSFNHLAADSEQVPMDQPFVVSGERLMHPGDTSLGASVGNVVNCRCASVVDVEDVVSVRMRAT